MSRSTQARTTLAAPAGQTRESGASQLVWIGPQADFARRLKQARSAGEGSLSVYRASRLLARRTGRTVETCERNWYRWESGRHTPELEYRRVIAEIVGVSEEELFRTGLNRSLSSPVGGHSDVPGALRVLTAPQITAATAEPGDPHAALLQGCEDLGLFRLVFERIGGAGVREHVDFYLDQFEPRLLSGCPDGTSRRRAHKLLAEFYHLAGVIHDDSNAESGAQMCWSACASLAQASNDPALMSLAWLSRSEQAMHRGELSEARRLVSSAFDIADGNATPTVMAMLCKTESMILSTAGDDQDAERSYQRAADYYLRSRSADDPGWARSFHEGQLISASAHTAVNKARRRTGDPLAAVDIARRAISLYPAGHHRSRQQALNLLIAGYLLAGDPDNAAHHAREWLRLSLQAPTQRATAQLRDILLSDGSDVVAEHDALRMVASELGIRVRQG